MTSLIRSFSDPLLDLAALALRDSGYSIERIDPGIGAHELLVAENEYFVLCIAAAPSAKDLIPLESEATRVVVERVGKADVGAKRWDIYVVLLSPDVSASEETVVQSLREIGQNTLGLRRVIRLAVRPTLDSVERALLPFLPLRSDSGPNLVGDVLVDLERELTKHGITESDASRLVAAYRSKGGSRAS